MKCYPIALFQGREETVIFNLNFGVPSLLACMTGCITAKQNATSISYMMAGYEWADSFRHIWLDMAREVH